MRKILLYPHGGSGNHGCEAIVRSTMLLLRPEKGSLVSSACGQDVRCGLDRLVRVLPERRPIRRLSPAWAAAWMRLHVLGVKDAFDRIAFGGIVKEAGDADLALCGGGDNYCYGEPVHIYLQNELLRKAGVPVVLWGCSLEREDMKGRMLEDLGAFDLIVARESLTYDALRECGLSRVVLYPDPAFALPANEVEVPEGWKEGNMAGINVSPMVIGHEARPGAVMENYSRLVEWLLENTEMNVALIPHVVWAGNDDRRPLAELHGRFRHTGRVIMIEDASCGDLKGYISRCRFLVAARTHASIAAYSTGIPALVAGYSVKARGIARDLFGTEEGHVVPVQSLDGPDELRNAFVRMMEREKEIKKTYGKVLPAYLERLRGCRKELESLVKRS